MDQLLSSISVILQGLLRRDFNGLLLAGCAKLGIAFYAAIIPNGGLSSLSYYMSKIKWCSCAFTGYCCRYFVGWQFRGNKLYGFTVTGSDGDQFLQAIS